MSDKSAICICREDESNTIRDEVRLDQLKEAVMQMAAEGDPTSEDFMALSREISKTKQIIAEKRAGQDQAGTNEPRMNEVLSTLCALKNHPIDYDDNAARQLIDCIKVMTKHELVVIFKGGIEKTIMME